MKGYKISLALTLYIMEGTFDQYKKKDEYKISNLCFFEFDIIKSFFFSYVLSVLSLFSGERFVYCFV